MSWCFAKVNNRLAEIFFDEGKNKEPLITEHCYVRREEYKTKKEQKWIDKDIKNMKVVYRKGRYRLSGGAFNELEYQTYAAEEFDRMEKDRKKGKNLIGPFDNTEEAIKYLNSK